MLYTIEQHYSATTPVLIPPHKPSDYDKIRRIYDMISPGNQIFVTIKPVRSKSNHE